jgi:hypothetical protein
VPFRPLDEFVSEPHDREDEDWEVVGDEGRGIPVIPEEDRVRGEEEDDGDEDEGVPSGDGVMIEDRSVRKSVSVDTLRPQSLVESNVGERDTPPCEKTTGGSQVGEVTESFTSRSLKRHVGKTTEKSTEDKRDPWKTVLGSSGKDLGSLSRDGQTVKSSGRGEEIGRSGRPGGGEETSVDDGRQSGDTGLSDSNDERRSKSVTRVELETSRVGRDNKTNDEGTTEVEHQNSDVDLLDGRRKSLSGVSSLSSGNGDNLGTNVREGGLSQDSPETEELTKRSLNTSVLGEGSRVSPVLETDLLAVGSTTGRDDDTEDDKTDDGQDLDGSEPELAFTVDTGTKEVDDDDDNETERDPESVVYRFVPEVNENGSGREFGRHDDDPVVLIVRWALI